MASLYFVALPVVWLGVLGPEPLQGELMTRPRPHVRAAARRRGAKAAAIWFMVLNMFHGTLQPLAGASRTLSQLADDGAAAADARPALRARRAVGRDAR